MAEASKTCTRCKEPLPLSAFGKDKNRKDGLNYRCRACAKKDHTIDYAKHKERRKAARRRWYSRLKQEIFDHYGRTCKCCGETEVVFLAIDHINNDGAEHKKNLGSGKQTSGTAIYNSIKKQGFPDTFQVLCFNCNWAKSHGGCPHQKTSKLALTQS